MPPVLLIPMEMRFRTTKLHGGMGNQLSRMEHASLPQKMKNITPMTSHMYKVPVAAASRGRLCARSQLYLKIVLCVSTVGLRMRETFVTDDRTAWTGAMRSIVVQVSFNLYSKVPKFSDAVIYLKFK